MAGPVNGHLYAQVDKAFKKRVRSLSFDSGVPQSSGAEQLNFFENRANTLTRRNAYGFKNRDNSIVDVKLSQPRLQFLAGNMENSRGGGMKDEVKSIDKLLQELGECSEFLDTTMQQARPAVGDLHTTDARGSRSVTPPGVPVRNASFDAGSRYNRNGTPGMMQNGFSGSTTKRSPTALPPYYQNYAWYNIPNAEQIPNGYTVQSPRQESSVFVLHEAPLAQTSPPVSPLSPKFYATQMMPRTFKATTVSHTTVGYNPHTNGWTGSDPGKQRDGPKVLDFNNNKTTANGVELFDLDGRKEIEDLETLPEKGNVKSKIALLTDKLQSDKVHAAPHQHLRCQIIPMPGLTSVSPTEVFKEISSYNAKSLAPGELSHSSGTLYSSKAPPKRIVEPSKHVASSETPPEDIDIVAVKESLKRISPVHEFLVHNHKTGTVTPSSFCVTHCHRLKRRCS